MQPTTVHVNGMLLDVNCMCIGLLQAGLIFILEKDLAFTAQDCFLTWSLSPV